jgi:hypothetical protein
MRRTGTVARPAARAASSPASKVTTRSGASSAAAVAGGFRLAALGVFGVVGVLAMAVLPVASFVVNGQLEGFLLWPILAFCLWAARHEQRYWLKLHGKPKPENYSAGAAFRERWGLAEERCAAAENSALEATRRGFWAWAGRWAAPKLESTPASPAEPVPCFIAFEGNDPHILEARPYTTVDAVMNAHAEAQAAGLSREDTIEHMARVLRGVGRKPFGTGGELRQSGSCQLESDGDHGLVIEAKAEKVRLPRWN